MAVPVFLFAACVCTGQGFRNPPEGTAALSQAGAFIAQCDDASAVSLNPAGLVQLKGNHFSLGANLVLPSTEYSNGVLTSDREKSAGVLPYFYFCSDLGKEKVRFGLGVTSPFGQATRWKTDLARSWGYVIPFNPVMQASIPYDSGMQTADIVNVLSYRVNDEFSFAAGIHTYVSRITADQLVLVTVPVPTELVGKLRTTGYGFAPAAGMLYRKSSFRAGLNFRGGCRMKYEGKYRIPGVTDQDAKNWMKFPPVAGLGLAFFPRPDWKIETDVEWLGFSCLKGMPVDISGVIVPNEKNWDDCFTVALGTEYRRTPRVTFRGGIAYIQSPVPAAAFEPTIPDADRIAVSVGADVALGSGRMEVALVSSIFQDREIRHPVPFPYDGTYSSSALFLTLGYGKPL